MKDIVVIESLRKRGAGLQDVQEILQYEAVERKPRYLDKAPKRLSFNKASDIQPYSCYTEFFMHYDYIKESCQQLEQATLDLKGAKRFCDVDVYIALRALINTGVCNTEEKAFACFDLFKIIMMTPGDTLTAGRVKKTLDTYKPANYYAGELVKALYVCLFDEKISVLYWMSLCDISDFYKTAIELGKPIIRKNCETEKDVEKFLRPVYKQAKEDKEFMENVYTPGANKWLIPVLYLLKDEHPEALEPNSSEGGFAN